MSQDLHALTLTQIAAGLAAGDFSAFDLCAEALTATAAIQIEQVLGIIGAVAESNAVKA